MGNEEKVLQCIQCGGKDVGQKADGTYFCRSCGAEVKPVFVSALKPRCCECGSEDIGQKYDGGKFCRSCGADVKPCAKCGGYDISKGYDGTLFCRSCGASGRDLFGAKTAAEDLVSNINFQLPKVNVKNPFGGNLKKLLKMAAFAAVVVVAVVCTLVFVQGNAKLVNVWKSGANTVTFTEDGNFTSSFGGISTSGTYEADESTIHLSYKYMGLMDKTLDWGYAIKGKKMTVDGDVSLTGVVTQSVEYETEKGEDTLKIILVVAEVVIGAVVFVLLFVRKKKTTAAVPSSESVRICPKCHAVAEADADFCGECGQKL